ncbi:restriction endonuclease subunit S [Paraferrimonas haliotis]|uniref:restriction endonuclease subunit S n=1 Tax=Paraferrimonas haliotis TaxID=2013866 RepID=UPI000BA91A4E|nr:restriction endonuclease subunit S [Paraferrimonas haliotis]
MNIRLGDIADVQLGHPFRGSIKAEDDGDVHVLQVRDTDETGEVSSEKLVRTTLTGRKSPDWLQTDDVLFVAKGSKHYAVHIGEQAVPEQTVCSPHFFMVRVKPELNSQVLPAFLGWQINQKPAQRYFTVSAEGSLYLSIRKQILEDLPLTLPSIEKQQQLIAMHKCAMKEQKVLKRLIENRQQQLDAIALKALSGL